MEKPFRKDVIEIDTRAMIKDDRSIVWGCLWLGGDKGAEVCGETVTEVRGKLLDILEAGVAEYISEQRAIGR